MSSDSDLISFFFSYIYLFFFIHKHANIKSHHHEVIMDRDSSVRPGCSVDGVVFEL